MYHQQVVKRCKYALYWWYLIYWRYTHNIRIIYIYIHIHTYIHMYIYIYIYMEVSVNGGTPTYMVHKRKSHRETDDLEVRLFQETTIYTYHIHIIYISYIYIYIIYIYIYITNITSINRWTSFQNYLWQWIKTWTGPWMISWKAHGGRHLFLGHVSYCRMTHEQKKWFPLS